MAGIPPAERPTALIFQNLALFPLMSVRDNVAFGLEARGMQRAARRARADELLELVALEGHGDKRPDDISGGQRQRVAVARAHAVEPSVLLLDDPLSALDLKLRQHMRIELKDIQRRTGVTFISITHDQSEALATSDRIAVMSAGRIEQVGTGDEVYDMPATRFVAGFVGEQNRLRGRVTRVEHGQATVETALGSVHGVDPEGLTLGTTAELLIRPERIRVLFDNAVDHVEELRNVSRIDAASSRTAGLHQEINVLDAELERRDPEGSFIMLQFRSGGRLMSVQVPNGTPSSTPTQGHRYRLGFHTRDALVMRTDN
jgi:spermidine/putrescine transport system ATP-binding protein